MVTLLIYRKIWKCSRIGPTYRMHMKMMHWNSLLTMVFVFDCHNVHDSIVLYTYQLLKMDLMIQIKLLRHSFNADNLHVGYKHLTLIKCIHYWKVAQTNNWKYLQLCRSFQYLVVWSEYAMIYYLQSTKMSQALLQVKNKYYTIVFRVVITYTRGPYKNGLNI